VAAGESWASCVVRSVWEVIDLLADLGSGRTRRRGCRASSVCANARARDDIQGRCLGPATATLDGASASDDAMEQSQRVFVMASQRVWPCSLMQIRVKVRMTGNGGALISCLIFLACWRALAGSVGTRRYTGGCGRFGVLGGDGLEKVGKLGGEQSGGHSATKSGESDPRCS
jgi:hypothetical protein